MIPQLDIGKRPRQDLHADMLLGYPAHTPFGNMNLAEVEFFSRVDYLNVSLERLYRDWKSHVAHRPKGIVPPDVVWLRYRTEDIIYHLRKMTDTLIGLSCILGERAAQGKYADRITVDSVGSLLNKLDRDEQDCPDWMKCYRAHRPFLVLVNDISNTYKHHFVNHETLLVVASEEPSAFYLASPQNKAAGKPELQGVRISRLVRLANYLIHDVRADHRRVLAEMCS